MLKVTEQNDKLKHVIILSIALHCVLIAVLIWSSIHQPQETSAGGSGSSIDAVMVDPGAVVQQYNRQQQQTDAQQRAEELQQKQAAEQQHLKALEKQRLAAEEAAEAQQRQQAEQKKQAEAQAKVEAAAQAKAAVAAKQQEAEAKKATAAEAKKQADVKAKAEEAAAAAQEKDKAKADQAAKEKAAAKQSSEVDNLLDRLSDAKNAPKSRGAPTGTGNSKQSGASSAEINAYKAQISRAISNKFYDASSYNGKTCDLHIKLAPDGMLISISSDGGDPALCQAAVSAAKLATIPKPPSPQVYEVFKNAALGFSPQ